MCRVGRIMSESGQYSCESERKQSLVTKCLNERRRRDQEKQYFEELAEIISVSISDMSSTFSVKPEKCAILQETVEQIKQIKQGGPGARDSAVQQSQVSSSKPTIITDDILGPLLLEALDGFLFVVNFQGKVEFVSDNVTHYLKYVQDDLIGASIYNIIHVGDHAQFSSSILPVSVSGGLSCPADNLGGKGRIFNCRLLIKPSCNDSDDLETKQTYVPQYESMQISSIHHSSDTSSCQNTENLDSGSSLVCIARRLPLVEKTNTMLGGQQFTTKLDLYGKIIGCDISGITQGRFNCPDFVGQKLQEFCHVSDSQKLSRHLHDVIKNGSNTSSMYKFRMQDQHYMYVQTKSKLFQNPASGSPEFIMSTHYIVRECDSEKGSASSSPRKANIGPSLQQNQTKSMPNSINSPVTSIGIVGNNVMTSIHSSKFLGNCDTNSNGEFISQMLPNSSVNSLGTLNSSQSIMYAAPSNSNILNPQLKRSQMYQQIHQTLSSSGANSNCQLKRNVPLSSGTENQQLQHNVSLSNGNENQTNNMGSIGKKRPQSLAHIGKWSSTSDLSQMQQQSPDQKSPVFAQSPVLGNNGGFTYPVSRSSTIGYHRRSPAASPVLNLHGNFNAPFPPRSPTPMLSPSPGLSQPVWTHQSSLSTGQHIRHQSDSQISTSLAHDRLYQQQNSLESAFGDKKVKRSGKLCQLLAQNSPPSGSYKSEPGTPKHTKSRHNSHQGLMELSPAESIQSPQPGPGQSPAEKPQSTSNDDGDHMVHPENTDSNRLLKLLLSQDEGDEDETEMGDHCSVKSEQTSESQSLPKKQGILMEMEKNEAEAKTKNNILLKHLLSTDDNPMFKEIIVKDSSSQKPASLLTFNDGRSIVYQLLDGSKMDDCRSVPAESSRVGSDQTRQRHQSEPQEPQSTTTHLMPMPPVSSPMTSPLMPTTPTQSQNTVDMSVLKDFLSLNPSLNVPCMRSNMTVNVTSSSDSQTINRTGVNDIDMDINENKRIDTLLQFLWEGNSHDSNQAMKEIQNFKRKADLMDMKSSDQQESAIQGLNSSESSKVAKDNALLTQLLSKKCNNEIVVNTLSTIQPSGIPQARIPPGIANRLLKVKPSSFVTKPPNESKRARSESGNSQMSTLQRALSAPKLEMSSSNQSFDAMMDIGHNSNSSISNVSDATAMLQLDEEYNDLQQILSNSANNSGQSSTVAMEMSVDTDPLLTQILQQAQDLQHDITAGSFINRHQNGSLNLLPNSGMNNISNGLNNGSSMNLNLGVSNSNGVLNQNNVPPSDFMQQLDLALSDPNLQLNELDDLFENSHISMEEQMAIDAIQKQLMMEMTGFSSASSAQNMSSSSSSYIQSARMQQRVMQNSSTTPGPSTGSQILTDMLDSQANRMQTDPSKQFEQGLQRVVVPGITGSARSMPQLPSYNQGQGIRNFPGHGPRLPHPQDAIPTIASPTQPQRPIFGNSNPNSCSVQVRQYLLQQQKMKLLRERDKQRLQQQQDQQKLLQQQPQFNPQYSQQFPRDNMSIGTTAPLPTMAFPENLADLMNSGTVPNVTLQHNQIPGPMSPCYQGLQQPALSPNMGQMIAPNPQLSPNFTQQAPIHQPQQWNVRQQSEGNSNISLQNSSSYNSRHRSMSGGSLQSSPPQQFPFSDSSHYQGNQTMYQPPQQLQQQQLYQQSCTSQLQRQISMPVGRGLPRTSQSPFGPGSSSDPLVISQGTAHGQAQQVSPSYNHGPLNGTYGQGSIALSSNTMTSPRHSQGHMGMSSHSLDMDISLFDTSKPPMDMTLSAPISSQSIKRELRNICNARSQAGTLRSRLMGPQSSPQYVQQQQQHHQQQHHQQQHHQQQHHQVMEQESELPADILEQINEMSREHGIREVEVHPQKREEAKLRYEKFRQQSSSGKGDPDSNVSSLFRNQLLSQGSGHGLTSASDNHLLCYTDSPQITIVQNQSRTTIEDNKPANQHESLLQQLLSE